MVRAPCCEKMGLKKGPWTQEEDHTLVSYIQRYGHGNWRALPKQAGLLRCGKSCRLRWTNYLRPDIKRGNFTKEEEDMIINLHEMLGNRWSAIAARLPGRTDNEIKNVWHTHLKRRLNPNQHKSAEDPKRKPRSQAKTEIESKPDQFGLNHNYNMNNMQTDSSVMPGMFPVSPDWTSHSDVNSRNESSSAATKSVDSFNQELLEIDESFWNEALLMDATATQGHTLSQISQQLSLESSSNDEDVDFWLRIFMEAGELPDLPQL